MSKTTADIEPRNNEIVAYWSEQIDEMGLAVDWCDAHERCWRCGYKSKLQQCHIIPKAKGGEFISSNLVLLCDRCHKDAPNSTDLRLMWIWIKSTCVPQYGTFLVSRGIQEFHRMFGKYPFSSLSVDEIKSSAFTQILDEEIKQTVIHWGQGRRNPSTLACIYARTEERFTNRTLSPVPLSSDGAILKPLMLNPAFLELLAILPNT